MKSKLRSAFYSLLITTFFFSHNCQILGQGRYSLTLGFGLPEMLNIGVQIWTFSDWEVQTGLSFGTSPVEPISKGEGILTTQVSIYRHFAGTSKLPNIYIHPWYWMIGWDMVIENFDDYNAERQLIDIRIGRNINFLYRIGMQIDTGVLIKIHEEIQDQEEWPRFMPALGIRMCFNLDKKY